jgi:hypothetical protein
LNNPTLNLGTVAVGESSVLTDTLSNPTASNITVGQPTVAGVEFKVISPVFPLTLAGGQQAGLSISFTPTSAGKASAVITFPIAGSTTPITLAVSATAAGPGALAPSPSSISFGNVVTGQRLSETEVFTNTGGSDITVSQVTITGSQFQLSGPEVPFTLAAGQSASCSVTFAPTAAGSASGNISVTVAQASATEDRGRRDRSNRFRAQDSGDQTATIAVSGTGVAPGALTATPSLSFPGVSVGANQTQTVSLTNSGGSAVTVGQASLTGAAFSLSGVSLPIVLPAGQSASFSVVFSPKSAGTSSGSVAISSTATDPTVTIPLSGTAIAPGSLTPLPVSLSFGSVQTGTSQSLSETLTNSGGSSLTLSQAAVTGSFSTTGLSLPLTLAPGQSTSFSVKFAPSAAGSASASLSIATTSSPLTISLSGTGTTPGTLAANPSVVSFASVAVGRSSTQPETLTNTGGSNLTISQANLTGTAFTLSGLSLPLTLAPEQSVSFNAVFQPQASGAVAGTLTIISTASDASLTIPLSASATTTGQLSLSPSSSSFGNVAVGANKSLTATLTATGASVTLSSASTSSAEFGVSGLTFPMTLAAGQSASFSIVFTPQSSGAAAATLSFLSNASNSPAVESATGTGTAPPQHQVELSWSDASSGLAGYNIYRSQVSGGPYAKVNSALEAASAYTDTSVTAGQTYYYVTTAVDSTGTESTYSNQATAVIPAP